MRDSTPAGSAINKPSARATASLSFSSTDFEDHTIAVDPERMKDARQIYFVFTEAEDVQFDAWRFEPNSTDGIATDVTVLQTPVRQYDISGRRVPVSRRHSGIIIEQYIDGQGVTRQRKRINN